MGAILAILLQAIQVAAQASATLKQAQQEGWAEDDARWKQRFSELDDALEKARRRL